MHTKLVLAAALFAGLAAPSGAQSAVPPAAATATVHIAGFKFVPATLTIHAGDRVTFINDDAEPHTVTAVDKSFDSEGLDSAQKWQHVFAKVGRNAYFCEMHPYMKGTIVVVARVKS